MAVWVWIEIGFAVVLLVAAVMVAVIVVSGRIKTSRLKQHYGREYERVVSETGSEKAARRELATRESERDNLDIVPLTPSALSDFTARWIEAQNGFVDNPAAAVGVADRLVTEVMRQRGYPVDDFGQRVAGISVDHPQVVENYRAAHRIHTSQQRGVTTEQRRKAFVHYRTLFDKLLETSTNNGISQEASA
jgi:hypothetical protein